MAQAEFIDQIGIDHVFLLDLSDEKAVERLVNRFSTASTNDKRADDADEASIRRRLQTYHRDTGPLVDFYQTKGILHEINGDMTIPEVTNAILEFIK